MPHTLMEVLDRLQNGSSFVDGMAGLDADDRVQLAEDIDQTLGEIGLTHESIVGPTGPAVMSFEAWSTEYLTDLARDNDANIEDGAVATWIASNADALTNALRKCAVGFMLDADPIPGGDD